MYPFVAYVALLMSPLRLGWSMSERCEVPLCFVGCWMMVGRLILVVRRNPGGVFFKRRQTWKFKGPFFIVFWGDFLRGHVTRLNYQCYVGTVFQSQYCKDPKIKESGVFKCLPIFHPLWAGKL